MQRRRYLLTAVLALYVLCMVMGRSLHDLQCRDASCADAASVFGVSCHEHACDELHDHAESIHDSQVGRSADADGQAGFDSVANAVTNEHAWTADHAPAQATHDSGNCLICQTLGQAQVANADAGVSLIHCQTERGCLTSVEPPHSDSPSPFYSRGPPRGWAS